MKFGEPSPCSVDMANGFMVERVKKTPPHGGIGLSLVFLATFPSISHDFLVEEVTITQPLRLGVKTHIKDDP